MSRADKAPKPSWKEIRLRAERQLALETICDPQSGDDAVRGATATLVHHERLTILDAAMAGTGPIPEHLDVPTLQELRRLLGEQGAIAAQVAALINLPIK